jgi:hypothetical protein
MAARKAAPKHALSEERKAEIRASADETRGRSMFDGETPGFGPQCRCGVPRKPPGLAKHVQDDGMCVVHPDKPPQPWTRGAERVPDDGKV